MRKRVPSWTGCFFAVLALVGCGLPFVEGPDYAWSLFYICRAIGGASFAWNGIIVLLLSLPVALYGIRSILTLVGAEWSVVLLGVSAAMARGEGLDTLLAHLSAGAWCHAAGCAGLALCFLFRRLDRVIFDSLLDAWFGGEHGSAAGNAPVPRPEVSPLDKAGSKCYIGP